jgi:hypothetical protein
MLKKTITSIAFLLSILFFYSCDKEIQLDLPPYSSKLVLSGELSTDKNISLYISRSIPVLSNIDSSGYLIKDAVVKVYKNNTFIGNATYQGNFYILNHTPEQSANYRVDVSSGNFPVATSNIKIPSAFNLVKSFKDSVGLDKDGFKYGRLSFSFNDEPGVDNYYQMLILWYNSGTQAWFPLELISNDVVLVGNEKLKDGSYLFSDRTFSGKTKSLAFDVPFGIATGTPKFEISIKKMNSDYYDYLNQVNTNANNGNGQTGEPIIFKSNVSNGLGMVGGVYNSKDTIF